jgi:tRNA (guanine-N(7)-)-methyltransferase subunit TRM82
VRHQASAQKCPKILFSEWLCSGSKTNQRVQSVSRLQCVAKEAGGQWSKDIKMQETLNFFAEAGSRLNLDPSDGPGPGAGDDKAVRDMLYHVENLRKRPGAED